jgi:hypothetical protein
MRGLAAHPKLNDEARVMLAMLSFTHQFYPRDGGAKAIKFRELVERSGIRNHGNLQRIINRLAEREVIRVEGSGRQTRTYSFIPIAEQLLSVNSAEQDLSQLRNIVALDGEHPRSSNRLTHKKKEQVLRTLQEGNEAGQVDQGDDDGAQSPSWPQLRLNGLLAAKERSDIEGGKWTPLQEEQLQRLMQTCSLPALRTRAG